ncbi:CRTAC1 family protein [Panacibacter ginsenosidivorans]|uniref:CRTAC1 family protein n=1 Tax=Panacibacter ginsenosidivorans TaxID=1813871 RepID=A0A5B8VBZ3_9BACT|nr:CRTAC1 family protein [Panacibacter ginsenosidivorans]QEC68842.1 CRTAC1 family protein [Panacibacter ginsenosidivorans]
MKHTISKIIVFILLASHPACNEKVTPNGEMINLLSTVAKSECVIQNSFCPEAQLAYYDSVLKHSSDYMQTVMASYCEASTLLELGDEQRSINTFERLIENVDPADLSRIPMIRKDLAVAYLRLGERINCIHNHGEESCVFPIQGSGIHINKTGSQKAIEVYETLLKNDPGDLESRWLLNIAYMTIGEYPRSVPAEYLIKGLDADTSKIVKPFIDAAINIGLNTKNMAGGSILEDFNNDGYLDIITSSWGLKESMHYCRNNGNGSFTDVSDSSGLKSFTGGLNIMQTDYNNDGLKDIFVLRGAWKGTYGKEPNSLLRNNGDGTFTDVTKESGLLSFHPTQAATWNDFNNDGWLDVFIGNESNSQYDANTSELYINNKNGTFTNVAIQSNSNIEAFIKGVTSGDYDNDGWPDIFISTLDTQKVLLKNEGIKNGVVHFKNVTGQAGLNECKARTFPTWFWDYDNDGWLDILVCSYDFNKSLGCYTAAEALHMPVGNAGKQFLFRNKHDGTFEDVTNKVGLNKVAFAMGANFGDIDNDGYPDIYLGTGNPLFQSLVPNKMFKNMDGRKFIDVTSSARVGNLQKGHGVSFADLDNDGDEDIYVEMGGAYTGDAYQNSLYINPGQNNNHWINLSLEGTICNRVAIGAKIKVTFRENGVERSVYDEVNSGGSFGSNPLIQHIGIGQASIVESIEIKWPVTNTIQVFKNLKPDCTVKIKEGNDHIIMISLSKVDFTSESAGLISCGKN